MTLRISAPGQSPAELPLEVLVNSTAVLAIKGAGKTYTGSVLAEELLERRIPVVVLDPTGAWWGLRSSADGTGPGYPIVVIGGEHGDIPLEPTAGAVVADAIVEHDLSAILDLSQFDSLGRQRRFVTDFAERIHHAKAPEAKHTPLALVIDEADEFCPQRVMGEAARMVGAIERIVKRDRIRGIWTILLSQRSASVNKDVLSQCHFLIAQRTVAKRDRDAIEDWIEAQGGEAERAQMMAGIARLPVGGAWLCEPGMGIFERTQIRERRTFDSSATPKPGETRVEPSARAEVDLGRLRAAIAATATVDPAPAADGTWRTPARLALAARDARIADLEVQLRERPTVEVPVLGEDLARRILDAGTAIGTMGAEISTLGTGIITAIADADRRFGTGTLSATPTRDPAPAPALQRLGAHPVEVPAAAERDHLRDVHRVLRGARTPTAPRSAATNGTEPLTTAQQRLLNALAWWAAIGVDAVDRSQLAFAADFKATGSHLRNRLSELRGHGLIRDEGSGRVALSDAGRSAAETPTAPLTSDAVQAMVLARLTGAQRKLLTPLLAEYPHAMTRGALATRAGFEVAGSHFRNRLSELRGAGLLEEPSRNTVGAHPMLFAAPKARRR